MKKVKYTFALPEDTTNKLNELSKLDSMSKPGVMRKAMEVYHFIRSEKKNGMKFFMSDKEGSEYKEVVFLCPKCGNYFEALNSDCPFCHYLGCKPTNTEEG